MPVIAEIAEDALWAAEYTYKDIYDGPGSETAAMRAAIEAYHESLALDSDASGTLASWVGVDKRVRFTVQLIRDRIPELPAPDLPAHEALDIDASNGTLVELRQTLAAALAEVVQDAVEEWITSELPATVPAS